MIRMTPAMTVRAGDMFLSRWWGLLVAGAGIDFADGWAVTARARHGTDTVLSWDSATSPAEGAPAVLTATGELDDPAGPGVLTTTLFRLYLPAAATAALTALVSPLVLDAHLTHPDLGPRGDAVRIGLFHTELLVQEGYIR